MSLKSSVGALAKRQHARQKNTIRLYIKMYLLETAKENAVVQ